MPMPRVQVCSIPQSNLNPYISSINQELGRLGVSFTAPVRTLKDIKTLLQPGLVLHFHWPSSFYRGATRAEFEGQTGKLMKLLDRAKAMGCRVVWTAHNVIPHENPFPELDHLARQQFIARCDHIVAHCRAGERALSSRFRNLPKVTILQHPSYGTDYPAPPDRNAARDALRIPRDDFVFLMFGILRGYKNLPFAVAAFRAAALPGARLLIAGGTLIGGDSSDLQRIVGDDPRITLHAKRIPHGSVPGFFAAADVALFSYERILASGGVALAQTMGRAVIAPRMGCLPDMVPEECGILYEPGSQESFAASLRRMREIDVEAMGRHGRQHVAKQSPASFAAALFDIYRGLDRR